jgi:hypothetical protein
MIPSYLGVFLEELEPHFDKLILFLFENPSKNATSEDHVLESSIIEVISLCVKKDLLHRSTMGLRYSSNIDKVDFDAIIVRSPIPLIPMLVSKLSRKRIVIPLVVGYYDRETVRG